MDLEHLDSESAALYADSNESYPESQIEPTPQASSGLAPRTRIALIILGLGRVGRAFLWQILKHARLHEQVYGVVFDVVAVSDSTAALLVEEMSQLESILNWKDQGQELVHHARATLIPDSRALVEAVGEPGAVLVDCTASKDSLNALLMGIEKGCRIVTANKKPLTETMQSFNSLAGPFPGYQQSRWESTVGAGLPVIATLSRLRAAGDEILSIQGSLSSTLDKVFTGLEEGRKLSSLVLEAIQQGVAEPDPREDLSGRDLARKALILARTAGWQAELPDVEVEGLSPESMETLSGEEFLSQLPLSDQSIAERSQLARRRARCLRYSIQLSPEKMRVGLSEIAPDHPLARLRGSEQLVSIKTSIYREVPLLIQGRGAGVTSTASGILSDILEMYRFSVK